MTWPGLCSAVLAAVALAATGGPADAATFCVDAPEPGCTEKSTAAAAFTAAGDGDRILLGPIQELEPLASADAVEVIGAGEERTRLGPLVLGDAGAAVADLRAGDLELTGTATRVRVDGDVTLRAGAVVQAAQVEGGVATVGAVADARLHSVLVRAAGGIALEACAGTLKARHVTVLGSGTAGARECPGATLELRDSVLAGEFATPLDGVVAIPFTVLGAQLTAEGRLPPGSPLLDTATPEPLGDAEWPEDRDRLPRVLDGDGDGMPERDPGAFEAAPAALPPPAGNLLADPGAETGGAWELTEAFTRARYGAFPFPSRAAAAALGAGDAFFAGGPGPVGTASQRLDVTGLAPEIDRGTATVTLSGLLGGYRGDGDAGTLEASFADPAGRPLAALALTAPSAAERANATTLVRRARTDAVPPLTRVIEVTMRATRASGSYDDAYFDELALSLTAPGAPPPPLPPPPGPGRPPVRPFVGVRVLTAVATVDAKGRVGVKLGCVDATVGRCDAVVTLTATLRKGAAPVRVGVAGRVLAPGAMRRVHLRLTSAARSAVRRRKRIRMTLFAAARDGQGITRVSTVPLVVTWPRKRPRARQSQPAGSVPAGTAPA